MVLPIFYGCAELQQIADQIPSEMGTVSNTEIASGLRQALNFGIEKQVSTLTREDGFFKNELVRITLPPELQKVDNALRKAGMASLADEGLKVLNRAAEDAVKEATPIFVNAVRQITFDDARRILTGNDTAATSYLRAQTAEPLYEAFSPVIHNSLEEVGANTLWSQIINRYNSLPLTTPVNPDLTDYVTQEALEGVFTMIAVEEQQIRSDLSARTTPLLRKVFALQD